MEKDQSSNRLLRLYVIKPPEVLRLYLKKSSEELGRLLIKLKNPQSTQEQ